MVDSLPPKAFSKTVWHPQALSGLPFGVHANSKFQPAYPSHLPSAFESVLVRFLGPTSASPLPAQKVSASLVPDSAEDSHFNKVTTNPLAKFSSTSNMAVLSNILGLLKACPTSNIVWSIGCPGPVAPRAHLQYFFGPYIHGKFHRRFLRNIRTTSA